MASLVLMGLFGCNTTPTSPSETQPAAPDRVLSFQERSAANAATIVVTRDQGFTLGGGCFYALFINGTLAARFEPGETASFYVEPGEILLRVGRDPYGRGLCAVQQDEWTQRETLMRAGETKHFRLLITTNGKADIQRAE